MGHVDTVRRQISDHRVKRGNEKPALLFLNELLNCTLFNGWRVWQLSKFQDIFQNQNFDWKKLNRYKRIYTYEMYLSDCLSGDPFKKVFNVMFPGISQQLAANENYQTMDLANEMDKKMNAKSCITRINKVNYKAWTIANDKEIKQFRLSNQINMNYASLKVMDEANRNKRIVSFVVFIAKTILMMKQTEAEEVAKLCINAECVTYLFVEFAIVIGTQKT